MSKHFKMDIAPEEKSYLVRVLDRTTQFYKHRRVCLGWSKLREVPLDGADYAKAFQCFYPTVKYDVWNFVHAIKRGTPAAIITGDNHYSVVRLLDYEYRPDLVDSEFDSAHCRGYEPILVEDRPAIYVPNEYFVGRLRHRLGQGSRGLTCYPLNPQSSTPEVYNEYLNTSLGLWNQNRPFSVKEVAEEHLAKELLGRIQTEYHHSGKLENLLVRLLKASGANEAYRNPTRQSADGDVDVEAIFRVGWEEPEEDLIRIGLQAKWRQGEQADADLEGFEQLRLRLLHPSCVIERGYLVTTASSFSGELVRAADELNSQFEQQGRQLKVLLIDGIRLAKWILNVGIGSLDV